MSRTLVRPHAPLAGLLAALPLVIAPFAAGAASPAPSGPPADVPTASEQLFALAADSGTVSADAAGDLTLTLDAPDPQLIQYADRPGRSAAWMPLDTFVAAWPVLFAGDPPNAVLSWAPTSADHAPGMLVLELGDPVLAADGGSLVLSAIAAPVAGQDLLATDWPDRSVPLALGAPSLAIDGAAAFTYEVGPVTVVGTPGADSLDVVVTLNGVRIGAATLTTSGSQAHITGTQGGVSADVMLQAEIPHMLEVGLLVGVIDVTGDPSGPLDFSGPLGTWPGPIGG